MARPAQPPNDDRWVADTGASQHLTGNLALLHNYVAYDHPVQVDVPGAQTSMLGHGTVYFRGPEGEGHFRLENVGYLPGSRGLMSLGKMHKANFSTITSSRGEMNGLVTPDGFLASHIQKEQSE